MITDSVQPALRTKRYLFINNESNITNSTSKVTVTLPNDYRASRNKKFIHVYYCRIETNDSTPPPAGVGIGFMPKDITIHSDIVHTDEYINSMIAFCNPTTTEEGRGKYEQFLLNSQISFWFRKMIPDQVYIVGGDTNPDGTLNITKYKFVIKLLLEY